MKTYQPVLPHFRNCWTLGVQLMAMFSVFQAKPDAAQTTDTDGDGVTNLWEYSCRTPPASGASTSAKFPPDVLLGIEPSLRVLVKRIMAQPAFNEGLAKVLGIEGTVRTAPAITRAEGQIQRRLCAYPFGGELNSAAGGK